MFLLTGHGVTAVVSGNMGAYPEGKAMSAEAACGFLPGAYPKNPRMGVFDYFFKHGASLPQDGAAMTAALNALADSTIENPADEPKNSTIPPVFTYMGQFIDHDITANTDREDGISVIDVKQVEQLPRKTVAGKLANLRFATLNLDSVYGGGPEEGDISVMLREALRWPRDRAKMEGGVDFDVPGVQAEFPKDSMRDLLRLGWAVDSNQVNLQVLANGPDDVKKLFFHNSDTTTPNRQRAILGDARNDENLAVAQFHMSVLRLHNEIVDAAPAEIRQQGKDKLFAWAQKLTRWTYQWLVLHAYLPAVCDDKTLSEIDQNGPTLYDDLIGRHKPTHPNLLPMPLEFSVAAFRFGHSMARLNYDWNRIFGRDGDGNETNKRASFNQLFFFTGNGMPPQIERLPSNWPIAMERFVHPPTPKFPDRSALKIDTGLNRALGDMANEESGDFGVLKHLARRNLLRGYRLNVPTAQGCIAEMKKTFNIDITPLSQADLLSGHTGKAIKDGGFADATPLWFYVLKEAEIIGGGNRLGPLGSRIIADTLIGLIKHDASSYFNGAPGGSKWKPGDSVKPNGVDIVDMPSMMRAAGMR